MGQRPGSESGPRPGDRQVAGLRRVGVRRPGRLGPRPVAAVRRCPEGHRPVYRLITDARFANTMYADRGVTHTTVAQLSSTADRRDSSFSVVIPDAYHLALWAGCGGELPPPPCRGRSRPAARRPSPARTLPSRPPPATPGRSCPPACCPPAPPPPVAPASRGPAHEAARCLHGRLWAGPRDRRAGQRLHPVTCKGGCDKDRTTASSFPRRRPTSSAQRTLEAHSGWQSLPSTSRASRAGRL